MGTNLLMHSWAEVPGPLPQRCAGGTHACLAHSVHVFSGRGTQWGYTSQLHWLFLETSWLLCSFDLEFPATVHSESFYFARFFKVLTCTYAAPCVVSAHTFRSGALVAKVCNQHEYIILSDPGYLSARQIGYNTSAPSHLSWVLSRLRQWWVVWPVCQLFSCYYGGNIPVPW